MKHSGLLVIAVSLSLLHGGYMSAQPDWPAIKENTSFHVYDSSYGEPYIQALANGGWEDGLYISRDGKNLYSTYLPLDAISWLGDLVLDPHCFDFAPYFRPPLLDIDTLTNPLGCDKWMNSDIIYASRQTSSGCFSEWQNTRMRSPVSYDGGAQGVLLDSATYDVFVFTKDGRHTQSVDIMFLRNVPVYPDLSEAVPILSTPAKEDNPHMERLDARTLVLFFDRDRYVYYSLSHNNGESWDTPVLVSNVLNDQAPYDVQPHLWNDGTDWWVYFCADTPQHKRSIYRSRQEVKGDWNSWGNPELVIEPHNISSDPGNVLAVGEPTLTERGDISFVVVSGNTLSADSTDVFDCDPWFLPKKKSP